jgi:hypothetical protein
VYAQHLNEQAAEGAISRAEARTNSDRAALTSFLGDLKAVDRSLRPFLLRKGDRVLLCSDGFYHALTEAEIIEAFRGDPQTACETLVERAVAKRRRQQDNLTVIALTNAQDAAKRGAGWRAVSILGGLILLAGIGAEMLLLRYFPKPRLPHPLTPSITQPARNAPSPVPATFPAGPSTPAPPENPSKSVTGRNQTQDQPRHTGDRSKDQTSKRKAGQKPPVSTPADTTGAAEGAVGEGQKAPKDRANKNQENNDESPKRQANQGQSGTAGPAPTQASGAPSGADTGAQSTGSGQQQTPSAPASDGQASGNPENTPEKQNAPETQPTPNDQGAAPSGPSGEPGKDADPTPQALLNVSRCRMR